MKKLNLQLKNQNKSETQEERKVEVSKPEIPSTKTQSSALTTAYTKSVRVSTRKVRLVADVIRNQSASNALKYLTVIDKRGAYVIEKTLRSAIANAVNNNNASVDSLVIKSLEVNEGAPLKRFHPSTRGRVHPYKRKATHIRVTLESKEKVNGK